MTNQTNCFRIALAGGRVFWASRGDSAASVPGSLSSVPLAGGSPTTHHEGTVAAVKPFGAQVLFADRATETIYIMEADGTKKTTFVAPAGPVIDLAPGGEYLWWTADAPDFQRALLTGSAAQVLADLPSTNFYYLIGTGAYVFALASTGSDPALRRVKIGDPNFDVVAPTAALTQLAVDATYVYFGTPSGVSRVAFDSSSPEALATVDGPNAIALDQDALYVTTDASKSCTAGGGQVLRIPFDTKTVEVLADKQDCPSGIAVDASGVYWVNAGSRTGGPLNDPGTGALMRAKRL